MAAIGPPVFGVLADEYGTVSRTTREPVLQLDEKDSLSQPRESRSGAPQLGTGTSSLGSAR
jgi:hypothetical protein